ncbi:unnamed protein product [Prunus armeniaca]|uniref:Uncharacterized protein n=1 Tax=Prunus armeniaca TaxID=36596 RepID=A0A6J5V286_PRUAR|nr:unnamed protein product [Prunus armeniaca]
MNLAVRQAIAETFLFPLFLFGSWKLRPWFENRSWGCGNRAKSPIFHSFDTLELGILIKVTEFSKSLELGLREGCEEEEFLGGRCRSARDPTWLGAFVSPVGASQVPSFSKLGIPDLVPQGCLKNTEPGMWLGAGVYSPSVGGLEPGMLELGSWLLWAFSNSQQGCLEKSRVSTFTKFLELGFGAEALVLWFRGFRHLTMELELGARARHSELGILVSLLFVLRSAKAGWKYLRPPCELVKAGLGRLGALIRFSYLDLCGCPINLKEGASLAVLAVKQLGYSVLVLDCLIWQLGVGLCAFLQGAGPWVICAHRLLRIRRKLELGSGLEAGPCHFQSPISFMSWPFVVISLGSTFVGLCSWCETLDHVKLELGHLKFGENFLEKVGYGCHSVSLGAPLNAVEFEAASHWVF